MKYRKKPVEVEAWQFTAGNYAKGVPDHIRESRTVVLRQQPSGKGVEGYVDTLEGRHTITENDWIIQGVHGEFYACKPDIFQKTYEPVR